MNQFTKSVTILFFASSLFWLGCATTKNQKKSIGQFQNEIRKLTARVKSDRNDMAAWRDLGAICYEANLLPRAKKFLTKAYNLDKTDPKTLYYIATILESEQKAEQALRFYKNYTQVSRLSPYRKKMEGQYLLLNRQMMRQEMKSLLEQEMQLTLTEDSKKTVAIFPLKFEGDQSDYATLGKGISEMIITDLSQVPDLQVVERIRLQALFEEMALGQAGIMDESTLPRVGKLLGAGKIINGSYNLQGKKQLQMDVAFWDVYQGQEPAFARMGDNLDNLFKLEKDLVFGIIKSMGIDLTPAEREKIQRIPTKNMQAFMAYCNGLDMEDSGRFEAAAQYFQKANKLDPNFQAAGEKATKTESLAAVARGNTNTKTATSRKQNQNQKSPIRNQTLVSNRLQTLSTSIGSTFIQGQDSRESAEEVQNTGVSVFDDLPLPPEPPGRR